MFHVFSLAFKICLNKEKAPHAYVAIMELTLPLVGNILKPTGEVGRRGGLTKSIVFTNSNLLKIIKA